MITLEGGARVDNVLIQLDKVNKKYDGRYVLRDIALSVSRGQSTAFIGDNGSGKSTLIRILAGLTKATSGKVQIQPGIIMNYIPERFPKMSMGPYRYIECMGRIEGLPGDAMKQRIQELFELFHIEEMQWIPMKHLSKGTLQKVAVIQAMLTEPDILFLDEPLSGQDMESQNIFIHQVNQLRERKTAVVLACHEKFLVHQLTDQVFELRGGQLVPVAIEDERMVERDMLIFHGEGQLLPLPEDVMELVSSCENKGFYIKLTADSSKSNHVIYRMLDAGWKLREMCHENT